MSFLQGMGHVLGGRSISSGKVFERGGTSRLCCLVPEVYMCLVGLVSCVSSPGYIAR